jgi:hypothetical protein
MFHADRAADRLEEDRLSIRKATGRAAPALNEAKNIARALKKIPEDAYQVVPVDGHPAEATVAVAPKEIKEPRNDGDHLRHVCHVADVVCNLSVSGWPR